MNGRSHVFVLFLLMCTFSSWIQVPTDATSISIDNNAYSNIVVAISPDVADTNAELIIQNIQLMIRRASSVLYRATKSRSYFKDVRILVPESWGNIRANVSTWETYSTADVRVAPAGSTYGDIPYTVQSGGCGQPGEYIHMTPDYLRTIGNLNNLATFGPPEKVFVHQWARLRYGVFEEYGQKGSVNYPVFFKPPNSASILPNVCTDKVPDFQTKDSVTQGPCKINPATGIYDDNCVFEFQPNFSPQSSLMSSLSISSVVNFCQDDQESKHLFYAPSKQNAMCQSTSVWTIITRHPDFANNNNPPNDISSLEPTFQIVKSSGSRFVLVADISGSMDFNNRIGRLYDTSRRWIKYDIPDGSQLGLVEFSSTAQILSPLVRIEDDASRQSLIDLLPRFTKDNTCIGCGLQAALQVLSSSGPGGVILLLTDGGENVNPFINEVLPELIQANVRVVSIASGRDADQLIEELAAATKGKSYFIDDNDTSQGLSNAFIGSLTYQPAVSSDQIIVTLFQWQYQNQNGGVNDSFIVDYTVGRNLVFRIGYTQKSYLQGFSLISPSGTIYTELDYDDANKLALFKLAEAEVGEWSFELTLASSSVDSVTVYVTSQTRSKTTVPITTECYVPDGDPVRILAKVMQGSNPVLQARVRAFIEVPNGPTETLELFDNGAFADTSANDGIYSRFFLTSSTGRYTVACEMWDDGFAYVNRDSLHSQARVTGKSTVTKMGPFKRISNGGSFKITQPVNSNVNSYPPSRIVDLVFISLMNTRANRSVTIQFSAPGEDLDSGTATTYEIRYSTVFDDLLPDNFNSTESNSTLVSEEHVIDGSLQPMAAGSIQTLTFLVNNSNSYDEKTYFVALRALDRTGLASQASNIVAAPFPAENEEPVTSRLSNQAIVGIVIGSLLATVLIAVISYLIAKKKYQSNDQADNRSKAP